MPGVHFNAIQTKRPGLTTHRNRPSDGHFEFQDLPVGTYKVALRADSGCGAAIGIDQSQNLGLTAAYTWA